MKKKYMQLLHVSSSSAALCLLMIMTLLHVAMLANWLLCP